jgi:hypothetical protein
MATCLERWLPGAGLPHDHRHGHGRDYDYDYDYDYDNEITPLAKPIFSIFPSSDELRSTAAPRKCSPIISSSSSYAAKRKSTTPQPSLARSSAKRSRFHPHSHSYPQSQSNLAVELHQSTCLNLTTPTGETSESDLWILPDFDEWEFENDSSEQESKRGDEDEEAQGTSTSLLQRAV